MIQSNQTKSAQPLPIAASDKVKSHIKRAASLIKENKSSEAYDFLQLQVGSATKKDKITLYFAIHDLFKKINLKQSLVALDHLIALEPKLTLPWLIKAKAFEEVRDAKSAVEALKKHTELSPSNLELVESARILSRFGEQKLALELGKRAYFGSNEDVSLATYPLRVCLQNADWETAEKITAKLLSSHLKGETKRVGETPRTHLLWCANESVNIKVIKNFAAKLYNAHPPMTDLPHGDYTKRKVRIGYLSSDFRDHATSILAMGMFRHHQKSRFEIFLYDTSYDDGSVMRRQVLSRADRARSLVKLSDQAAANVILQDKIDVLVDLNGLTEGTRLGILSYRPAPVQISYLGFPGSAGSPFVDYIIADAYTISQSAQKNYPEAIIRIPHTYQINDYIALYLPPRPPLRALGLPEDSQIIAMFNNVNKVCREVWDTWMQILQSTNNAVLWMLDPGEIARANLLASAKPYGIEESRFVWSKKVKQEEHLARLRHCSIALDPWPYGGHTTTSDALFAGVPVIALEGTNFASRVSGGLLNAAGLPSLVAKTKDDYVKLATSLLNNADSLTKIKHHLSSARRSLPIFDAPARTRHLETAYLHACGVASRKEKPSSFNIK